MADDSIKIPVEVDTSKANSELKSFISKADGETVDIKTQVEKPDFSGVEKDAKDAGESAGKGFGASFSGAAKIGMAAGGILAVAAGLKAAFDFTKETNAMRKQVATFSGLAGKDLTALTAKVQATSKVFEKDFNETLVSTNAVAKGFGISMNEAAEVMNKGFLAGADATGELLAVTSEYSPLLKQVGLDAESAMAVLTQSAKQGIFSDKGIDVLKEAGLRLNDMSDGTKAALQSIGISSAEMTAAIDSGAITSFEAMQQVSKALQDTELTASQTGVAITEIFGGPGEDAGLKYIQSLSDMNLNMDELVDKNAEFNGQQLTMLQIQEKLSATLQDVAGAISPVFNVLLELFANTLMPILTDIIKNVFPVIAKLAETIGAVLSRVLGSIMPVVNRILTALMPLITTILDAVTELLDPIMELIEPIIEIVGVLTEALLPVIDVLLKTVFPILITQLKLQIKIWTTIFRVIADAIQPLRKVGNTFKEWVTPYIEAMSKALDELIKWVDEAVDSVLDFFGLLKKEAPTVTPVIIEPLKSLQTETKRAGEEFEGAIAPMDAFGKATDDTGGKVKTATKELHDWNRAVAEAKIETTLDTDILSEDKKDPLKVLVAPEFVMPEDEEKSFLDKFGETALRQIPELDNLKYALDSLGENYTITGDAATDMIDTFASVGKGMVEVFQGSSEESLKAVIVMVEGIVQAMAAAIFAEALATPASVATFGVAGIAAAAAITALLISGTSALLQNIVVGANDGVVGLSDSYSTKPHGKDSKLAMLALGESVVTEAGTLADGNAEALKWVNKTGGSLADYYSDTVVDVNGMLQSAQKIGTINNNLRTRDIYEKQKVDLLGKILSENEKQTILLSNSEPKTVSTTYITQAKNTQRVQREVSYR